MQLDRPKRPCNVMYAPDGNTTCNTGIPTSSKKWPWYQLAMWWLCWSPCSIRCWYTEGNTEQSPSRDHGTFAYTQTWLLQQPRRFNRWTFETRLHMECLRLVTDQDIIRYPDLELADHTFDISNRSFAIPEKVVEDSLTDSYIEDIDRNAPTTYQILDHGTKRGMKKLYSSDGFAYNVKRQNNNRTWWWCSIRGKSNRCPATVSQVGDQFTPSRLSYKHPSSPDQVVAATISS